MILAGSYFLLKLSILIRLISFDKLNIKQSTSALDESIVLETIAILVVLVPLQRFKLSLRLRVF